MGAKQSTIDSLVMRPATPRVVASLGKQFGRLTVRDYLGVRNHQPYVRCDCTCGNKTIASLHSICAGAIKSCGCYHSECAADTARKWNTVDRVGDWKPVYAIYNGMMMRCYNTNVRYYCLYGGRGVTVCERWRGENGFDNFYEDMRDGFNKGMSIERLNNDLGYSPENCIWIPRSEQAKNRRYNWCVLMEGTIITAEEAARRLGMNADRIAQKLRKLGHDKSVAIPIEEITIDRRFGPRRKNESA